MYAEVALPIPLDQTFHYKIPKSLESKIQIGQRVLVPFGRSQNIGYVVGLTPSAPVRQMKELAVLLDEKPYADEGMIRLARWMADRYAATLGECLACIVPRNLKAGKRPPSPSPVYPLRGLPMSKEGCSWAGPLPPMGGEEKGEGGTPFELSAGQTKVLEQLLKEVEEKRHKVFLLHGVTDSGKTEVYLRLVEKILAEGKQVIYLLPEISLTPPFIHQFQTRLGLERVGLWHSHLSKGQRDRTWQAVRQGQIEVMIGARSAVFAPFSRLGAIVIDEEHESTYKQEDRPRYHAREVALQRGKVSNAMVVLGGATPSVESYWRAVHGIYELLELPTRVGERPLPLVRLIDRRPPSPPPSPSEGRGKILKNSSPLGGEDRGEGAIGAVFSPALRDAIEGRLVRREQVILFVNRRGFTPFLRCQNCGWVARCPRCSLSLVAHRLAPPPSPSPSRGEGPPRNNLLSTWAGPVRGGRGKGGGEAHQVLRCHGCPHREEVPAACPACQGRRLRDFGVGTQRVEAEVKKLWPFAQVARLDRDITKGWRTHQRIYEGFRDEKLDVLVGTQLVAKGFDFPRVTLVGVIDADVALHLPDFRAAERTFQLITQVAGRAGRGRLGGEVLVQTRVPDHYAVQAAQRHDYQAFYREEIHHRETLRYPPFCDLVNIVLRAKKEDAIRRGVEKLEAVLRAKAEHAHPRVDVLGPVPAPYAKLRGSARWQILLKGEESSLEPLMIFLRDYRPKGGVHVAVDVDPQNLL